MIVATPYRSKPIKPEDVPEQRISFEFGNVFDAQEFKGNFYLLTCTSTVKTSGRTSSKNFRLQKLSKKAYDKIASILIVEGLKEETRKQTRARKK